MSTRVASTLESTLSPAIAPDELRSVPSGVAKKYVDIVLVNTQVLERTDRNDQITSDDPRRPVRPVAPTGQTGRTPKNDAKPKTPSSGGTPSEIEDLGLS